MNDFKLPKFAYSLVFRKDNKNIRIIVTYLDKQCATLHLELLINNTDNWKWEDYNVPNRKGLFEQQQLIKNTLDPEFTWEDYRFGKYVITEIPLALHPDEFQERLQENK